MPPFAVSDSDSENDAPDSVPLVQSKRSIREHDKSLRLAHAAQKDKVKAVNRERDRRLKERARDSKERRRPEGVVTGRTGVDGQAEREDRDEMSEDDEQDGDDSEVHGDSGNELNWEEESNEDDEDREDEEGEGNGAAQPTSLRIPRLPDHLFAEALKASAAKQPPPQASALPPSQPPRKKRKRTSQSLKVGSRTIKMLPDSNQIAFSTGATVPPRKVKQFLSKTLNLKGKRNAKGWERRPVNIGIFKSNGPALGFVRAK